ncbi:hypothetical protein QQF64_013564 [Cirrhinus molitorella]|uniref:SH3 domain-containing protein n=1 Tax=Cirrhinus molitorella TaxID=172907 RepID=A0ABR3LRI1_9TELE
MAKIQTSSVPPAVRKVAAPSRPLGDRGLRRGCHASVTYLPGIECSLSIWILSRWGMGRGSSLTSALGKCGDRIGLFPANFVQRVRPGERVWKVTQSVYGNKDLGHLTVNEAQICVGKSEEADGFLKLSSGKKRGLVPTDSLEEI